MKQLRWGVLGTGNIVGKGGMALHRAANGEWLGVAGRTLENSKIAAEKYGVPRAYNGYRELIDDPEIDAVYIALLNHVHKEWAIEAVRAGKHVLLEKPFALNAADAADIIAEAKRHNARVEEAFVWRYMEGHLAAREAIRSGQIGDPVFYHGNFSFQAAPSSTRLNEAWGGGTLYDIGCYLVSWARFQFQEEPEFVDSRMIRAEGSAVDLRFSGTLLFPGGGTAHMTSALDMPYVCGYHISGTKGEVEVKQFSNAQTITLHVTINGETKEYTTDRVAPFCLQAEQFARYVLEGDLTTDSESSIMAQARTLDALFESDRKQARIQLGAGV
ncbi:MAG: oxidoreductase [Paenibacillus sp.]|jgi:predicted dehydrogenase|nr:oxidoreductase [Paenibacillus sp.]